MSKVKSSKAIRESKSRKSKEWPAVVYFWSFGLTLISYATARIVLDGKPHPYHWLAALLGGLAGIPVGWLWYKWRGDIF